MWCSRTEAGRRLHLPASLSQIGAYARRASLKAPALAMALAVLQQPAAARQADANAQSQLDASVAQLQKNPADVALREKIIALVQQMNPPPAVPEEANRHLVRALAFVKEAQSDSNPASDLDSAIGEMRQALLAAPWWGIAYYNAAVVEEKEGQFNEATADLKLYLLTRPAAADAKAAQDKIYEIEVEKEIAQKRNAQAQAAAERKQENADWEQLKAALAEQDKERALGGPWLRINGQCSAANASVEDGSVTGSMTFVVSDNGATMLGKSTSSRNLVVGFNGTITNGAIEGQATFDTQKIGYGGACEVPASGQGLSGSISADGRSMELDTTVTEFSVQTQGLIFTTCTNISTAAQQTARCMLASAAPHLIPLQQVVNGLPPGSPNITQAEAVRMVLANGGDVNEADGKGITALHIAALLGNREMVELLIANGAQVNALNRDNEPPLSYAVSSGSVETVTALLAHGARADLVNTAGMSPLYIAVAASGEEAPSRPPAPSPPPARMHRAGGFGAATTK